MKQSKIAKFYNIFIDQLLKRSSISYINALIIAGFFSFLFVSYFNNREIKNRRRCPGHRIFHASRMQMYMTTPRVTKKSTPPIQPLMT